MNQKKSQERLEQLKNYDKTKAQQNAFAELNKRFDGDIYVPRRYGQIEPKLANAVPYDTPRFLKDWSQDKRKVIQSV